MSVVASDGRVWRGDDDGGSWQPMGEVGGMPAAFETGAARDLLVALHDGSIKQSTDDGRSRTARSEPD